MDDRPSGIPEEQGVASEADPGPRTPRWVKLFGIAALVLLLLFVASIVAGIRHGPGVHQAPGAPGGSTPAVGSP